MLLDRQSRSFVLRVKFGNEIEFLHKMLGIPLQIHTLFVLMNHLVGPAALHDANELIDGIAKGLKGAEVAQISSFV